MYTQRYYGINNYCILRRGEVLLHPNAKAFGFSRPLRSTSIKEHIEPGDWVALDQNGEAVKGDAPNKLQK